MIPASIIIFNHSQVNMVENVEVGLTNDKLENNNTLKTEDVVSKLSNGSSDRSNGDPSVAKLEGRLRPGKSTGLRVITNIANVEIIQNGGPNGDFVDFRDDQKEHPMLGHALTNEDDEVDCLLFKLATIQDNDASSSVTSDGGTGSDALSPSSLASSSCTTPTETDGYGRRKSALKSPGLRPDTPSRKSVRFADALGLDLETVKHILEGESPPDIPEQAFRDLQITSTTPRRNSLSLTFQQPSGKPDFMHRLWKQNVCLENALISDFMIIGTIKVINIDYHKRVIVRYSIDQWRTFNEILASYVHGSHNGPTDRFSFGVSIPRDLPEGGCVYFAIGYDVASKRFWDNNDGKDYSCICYCDGTDDAIGASAWTHFL